MGAALSQTPQTLHYQRTAEAPGRRGRVPTGSKWPDTVLSVEPADAVAEKVAFRAFQEVMSEGLVVTGSPADADSGSPRSSTLPPRPDHARRGGVRLELRIVVVGDVAETHALRKSGQTEPWLIEVPGIADAVPLYADIAPNFKERDCGQRRSPGLRSKAWTPQRLVGDRYGASADDDPAAALFDLAEDVVGQRGIEAESRMKIEGEVQRWFEDRECDDAGAPPTSERAPRGRRPAGNMPSCQANVTAGFQ
ncbi:hypothetical protein [Candidatus Amarobacter glycogenicus]|uniref:hypothetical protein n=1 Tax=Candidatus Amarobacter glycogenicus TaxID=3140699 RepID=UPI003136FAF9|nr:hypothetical protein [Dehalococcoidia bacterium]